MGFLDFLYSILGFGIKAVVVLLVILVIIAFSVKLLRRSSETDENEKQLGLKSIDLKKQRSSRRDFMQKALKDSVADPKARKELKKEKHGRKEKESREEQYYQAQQELIKKAEAEGEFCPQNLYVLSFKGDTSASSVTNLRHEIDAILDTATDRDEVIVNLTSPGGVVNTYGLCSSELKRIRDRGIFLTVCVDNVAASGGYLMACVASKIVAAPFSYIGSIGVVMQLPNFHRLMQEHKVDFEQITAGKYKRTVTMFGENTDAAREKMKSELETVHRNFKDIVVKFRPQLDIDNIATGEFWLANDAKDLGLVDEIATSDEYVEKRIALTKGSALKIIWKKEKPKTLSERLKKLLKASCWVKAVRNGIREEMSDNSMNNIK